MFELMLFGTWPFWMSFFVLSVILVSCMEKESYLVSFVSACVFVLCWGIFGDFSQVVGWIVHNPVESLIFVVGYFVIAAVWGVVKWWLYVFDVRDKNREQKKIWLSELPEKLVEYKADVEKLNGWIKKGRGSATEYEGLTEYEEKINVLMKNINAIESYIMSGSSKFSPELLELWKKYESEHVYCYDNGRVINISKPSPEKHKGRIISWIVYWPISLSWTFLNDPIKKISKWIYKFIARILNKISNSTWKNEDDFQPE